MTVSSTFKFTAKRLVLVDSTAFAYNEIPLDRNATLLAKGNIGKTSSLNALLLFMLPENNFKNCETKFGFVGADGYHDRFASYEYYFPSNQSFIIFESSVTRGSSSQSHCHIIHRHSAAESSYRHIFTTLAYDQIRELFWDTNDPESGIGRRVEGLSHENIFSQLKKKDKYAIQTRDQKKIQSLIFNNEIMSSEAMRYSIFPLSKNDDGQIESFRAISKLLFNMKTGDNSVAEAVAHIIEAGKKARSDELVFDIDSFMSRHKSLGKDQARFALIDNLRNEFDDLLAHQKGYNAALNSQNRFSVFDLRLTDVMDIANASLEDASALHIKNSNKLKDCVVAKREIEVSRVVCERTVKKETAEFTKFSEKANNGSLIISKWPGTSIAEIISATEEDVQHYKDMLIALEDVSETQVKLKKLDEDFIRLSQKKTSLERDSESGEYLLSTQLSPNATAVLNAVSSKFVNVNPHKQLSDLSLQKIEDFICLFSAEPSGYSFFGTEFLKKAEPKLIDYQHEINEINGKIKTVMVSSQQLRDSLKDSAVKGNNIKKERLELLSAQADLDAIVNLSYNEQRVAELLLSLEKIQVELSESLDVLNVCIQENFEASELFTASEYKVKTLKEELVYLNGLKGTVRLLHSSYPSLALIEPSNEDMHIDLNEETLADISFELNSIAEHRSAAFMIISSKFLYEGLIDATGDIRTNAPSWHTLSSSIDELSVIYANIDSQRQVLVDKIRNHNETAQSYANVLTANSDYITRFASTINADFKKVKINDLTAIEIKIETDKRFDNLVADISLMDFYQDKMLSERFYERLESFSAEFFKGGHAKLTMNHIIKKIGYRVKKGGGDWDDKGQSNSTTSMINLKLVQVLLRRLITPSCSISYPLILDEAANVSADQFNWLLEDANSAGFNMLFAATHSLSPEVIAKIGEYHPLDSMRTSKPYHPSRDYVYWNGGEKFEKIDAVVGFNTEQEDLFCPDESVGK
jgi:hypothetical protein